MSVKLLEALRRVESLDSDAALARELDLHPPVISKIRNGKQSVGASMILAIHRRFGWNVSAIDALLNDARK